MRVIFPRLAGLLFISVLLLFNACDNRKIKYTDVTISAGIDFMYNFGDYTYKSILESSGSGVTVFDYNGDGLMDLFLMNGTYLEGISDKEGIVFLDTPDNLYRNNGDGTFTDVSKEAGIYDVNWSMAAGAIDYDNDGDASLPAKLWP